MSDFEKEKREYQMSCVECGKMKNLSMIPHRDKYGKMVGVLFACEMCRESVQGGECIIDTKRDEEITRLLAEIERLTNMLEDVVNELDLSDSAIYKHGPLGTPPSELVALVLREKQHTINTLRAEIERRKYTVIELGEGKIEVGAGEHKGRTAVLFCKDGPSVVGEYTQPRTVNEDEIICVIEFKNVECIDVVIDQLNMAKQPFQNKDESNDC